MTPERIPLVPPSLISRIAAFGLDYILIAAYLLVVVVGGLLFGAVAPQLSALLFGNPWLGELTGFVVLTLPVTLYFALSERSAKGGTWGKRRMQLRVLTGEGQRIGLGRSLLRSGLKFLPWEMAHAVIWQFSVADPSPMLTAGLVAVWLLVALNLASALTDQRRRALYDRAAGTVVVSAR